MQGAPDGRAFHGARRVPRPAGPDGLKFRRAPVDWWAGSVRSTERAAGPRARPEGQARSPHHRWVEHACSYPGRRRRARHPRDAHHLAGQRRVRERRRCRRGRGARRDGTPPGRRGAARPRAARQGRRLAGRRLRESRDDLAIIMATGAQSFDAAREGMRLGVMDYLLKPFSRQELRGRGGPRGQVVREPRRERARARRARAGDRVAQRPGAGRGLRAGRARVGRGARGAARGASTRAIRTRAPTPSASRRARSCWPSRWA